MDYGKAGLIETLVRIKRSNLPYVGAGRSKKQAQSPVIIDWGEIRVGILARCEIQFGVATDVRSGAAGFDATIYSQIKKLKNETDLVVVSIHAAAEMAPWPSPRRQDVWRSLIDAGADVVHGHHSHVPQGWEWYGNGLICYGLGNFCVDPEKWRWHPYGLWSLAPELSLKNGGLEMMPKTTVIDDLGNRIRVRDASVEEAEHHQRYFFDCNRPLSNSRLLEGLWQEVSIRMYQAFYSEWLCFNSPLKNNLRWFLGNSLRRVKRVLLQKSDAFYAKNKYLLWYHMFSCESHNDAISTAFGVLGGELEDFRSLKTKLLVDKMFIIK